MRCRGLVGAAMVALALGACTPPPDPELHTPTLAAFELELADEACRMQAADELLDVEAILQTRPYEGGAYLTLQVTRDGETYPVRCTYTAETGDAVITGL